MAFRRTTVMLTDELIDECEALGINLSAVCREALENEIVRMRALSGEIKKLEATIQAGFDAQLELARIRPPKHLGRPRKGSQA